MIMYEMKLTVGQEKSHEILSKLEEASSRVKLVSTPEVRKVVDALQTSCADLHRSVEDPLPAAKAAADDVLAARMDKETNRNAAGVNGCQTTCGIAGPSSVNNIDRAPNKGVSSLMDRNPTAQTYQVCVCACVFPLLHCQLFFFL
jgi:telomeric repeat-binding factor 2